MPMLKLTQRFLSIKEALTQTSKSKEAGAESPLSKLGKKTQKRLELLDAVAQELPEVMAKPETFTLKFQEMDAAEVLLTEDPMVKTLMSFLLMVAVVPDTPDPPPRLTSEPRLKAPTQMLKSTLRFI